MHEIIKHIENMFNVSKKTDLCRALNFDIGMSEFITLNIISTIMNKAGKNIIGVSDIVSNTLTSPQATSKCLNLLEQKGYISRFLNKNDKRRMEVSLTKNGKNNFELIKNKMCFFMKDVISGFDEGEYKTLVNLLNKFDNLYVDKITKLETEAILNETI